jgi:hypothetical protein
MDSYEIIYNVLNHQFMFRLQMDSYGIVKTSLDITKEHSLKAQKLQNTPIYSRSSERKKVQAFCLLQIFFSGIRTT